MSKQFLPIFAVSLQSLLHKEGEHQGDYIKRLLCILKRVNGDDSDDIESSDPIGALICNLKSEVSDWAKEARAIVENGPSSPLEALITELLQSRKRCVFVQDLPIVKDFTDEKGFVRAFISPNDSKTSTEVVNALIDAVVVSDEFKKKIDECTKANASEDGSEPEDYNSFRSEKIFSLEELPIDGIERLGGKREPECWRPLAAYQSTKTEGSDITVVCEKLRNVYRYSRKLFLIDDYLDYRPLFPDRASDYSRFKEIIDIIAVAGANKTITLVKKKEVDIQNPDSPGTSYAVPLCRVDSVTRKIDYKFKVTRGAKNFYTIRIIREFYKRMLDCIGRVRLEQGEYFSEFKIKIVQELHYRGTLSEEYIAIEDQDGFAYRTNKGFRSLNPMSLQAFQAGRTWDKGQGNVLMEIDMKKAEISFVRGLGNTGIPII